MSASLIRDFWSGFTGFLKGMAVTGTNLAGRRKITVQYPYERVEVSPRYRGLFRLPVDEEAGRLKCTGCTLCIQACPTGVISLTKLGAGKHGGVTEFTMDLGRCMFCNLCVEACPFEAIEMTSAYELASTDRNASVFPIALLTPGGMAVVERNRRTITEALQAEAAEKAAKAVSREPRTTGHEAPITSHEPRAASPEPRAKEAVA